MLRKKRTVLSTSSLAFLSRPFHFDLQLYKDKLQTIFAQTVAFSDECNSYLRAGAMRKRKAVYMSGPVNYPFEIQQLNLSVWKLMNVSDFKLQMQFFFIHLYIFTFPAKIVLINLALLNPEFTPCQIFSLSDKIHKQWHRTLRLWQPEVYTEKK